MDKKIYYSDDPIVEAEMIEEFGVPDEEYENAMKKCLTIDYNKMTTEELYEIIKHLEPEGYFIGDRFTREFFIKFIEFQRERYKY